MKDTSVNSTLCFISGNRLAIRIVNLAIALILIVVFMGGWTRINDAGLSCPDWPGCFGQWTVPSSQEELKTANTLYPELEVDSHKSWLEMIHRYLAGMLGLLILSLAIIALYKRNSPHFPHRLIFSLLFLVCCQALLGMWTVTFKLLPIIVSLHLFGGLLTTVLLLILRQLLLKNHFGHYKLYSKEGVAVSIGIVILMIQILLGGWTSSNYAGWGCSHWLSCNPTLDIEYDYMGAFSISTDTVNSHQGGNLSLPARGAIQIVHRIGAISVLLYFSLIYLATFTRLFQQPKVLRKYIGGFLILTLLQIGLGLMNIVWAMPHSLAIAHHIVAVAMLIVVTQMLDKSLSLSKGAKDVETELANN